MVVPTTRPTCSPTLRRSACGPEWPDLRASVSQPRSGRPPRRSAGTCARHHSNVDHGASMRPGDPAHGPTAPYLPADSGASSWPGHSPAQASFCVPAEPVQRSAGPGRGDRIRAGGPLRPEARVGCGHAAIRLRQRWPERAGTRTGNARTCGGIAAQFVSYSVVGWLRAALGGVASPSHRCPRPGMPPGSQTVACPLVTGGA
jgi:hypothetical protein